MKKILAVLQAALHYPKSSNAIIEKSILISVSAILSLALSACGGNESSGDSDSFIRSTTSNITMTSEARILYPQIDIAELEDFCESSDSQELVGCYISETCQIVNESTRLFVSSFTNDGQIRSELLIFVDQATCSSTYLEVGLSAFDMIYSIGQSLISSTGLEVQALDAEHHLNAGALGTLVTEYLSSYHLENNRLCFPAGDYSWGDSGGGLSFSTENDLERPTNMNFNECMVRLND